MMHFNVSDIRFGAIGNGQPHPLRWNFNSLAQAQRVYPHAVTLDDETDWAAIQSALNASRDFIRGTLARGSAPAIHRTGSSFSPIVLIPEGRYMLNHPLKVYPHTSIAGADWGHSQLQWTTNLPETEPIATNPQGVMWVGPTHKASALLWLLGDDEWPVGSGLKVAGMVNTIKDLGFKNHDGPAIFIGSNQNQLSIRDCWINGWGDGPTGLGIVANNPTSSTQITNLFLKDCMIEGCRAAVVIDRIVCGRIGGLQIESCGNGIYVGSSEALHIDDNVLTNYILNKPFENGIWLGLGIESSISNNTIKDATVNGIKILGKGCSVLSNRMHLIKDDASAIHIVTQLKQFGGDVSVLSGQSGPYRVDFNMATGIYDVRKALWLDRTQNEPEIIIS